MIAQVGLKFDYDFDYLIIECEALNTPISFGYLSHDYFANDIIHMLPQ
jgi:hypothetical protein